MVISPAPRYLNPIDLFGLTDDPVGSVDPALLQQANRIFQDQLRASGYEEFGFYGEFYTREELRQSLERLTQDADLREQYHRAARVAGLSQFLVSGRVADYFDVAALHEPELLPFVRDHFAHIYDHHTLTFFRAGDLAGLDRMRTLRIEDFELSPAIFFVQTQIHIIQETLRFVGALDHYFTDGASAPVVEMKKGNIPERTLPVAALSELPEYFGPQMDQIAETILAVAPRYASRNAQLVLDLVYYAHQLPHLLEPNRVRVNAAYDQLVRKNGDLERLVGRHKTRRKPGWIRFSWIVAIVVLLFRLASCLS